jgi:hypothetical protein
MPPAAAIGRFGSVHNCGNKRECTARDAVPACFRTLRYKDVRSIRYGVFRLFKCLHLANKQRTSASYFLSVRLDIAKGQHHCRWASLKHHVEQFRASRHAPSNKANPDAGASSGIHFALQPSFVTVSSANNAKPTRLADSRSQSTVSYNIHRSKQDWVLDVEQFS